MILLPALIFIAEAITSSKTADGGDVTVRRMDKELENRGDRD